MRPRNPGPTRFSPITLKSHKEESRGRPRPCSAASTRREDVWQDSAGNIFIFTHNRILLGHHFRLLARHHSRPPAPPGAGRNGYVALKLVRLGKGYEH